MKTLEGPAANCRTVDILTVVREAVEELLDIIIIIIKVQPVDH